MMRAGACDEKPSAVDDFHRPQIDFLVSPHRAFNGISGLGKRGGIEDDRIKAFPVIVKLSQPVEGVGNFEMTASLKTIYFCVTCGEFNRMLGNINAQYITGSVVCSMYGKRTGVGEAIQNLRIFHERPDGGAVFFLIQKVTGFLAVFNIDVKQNSIFTHAHPCLKFVRQETLFLFQAFKLPYGNIVPFVDACRLDDILQDIDNFLFVAVNAKSRRLKYKVVGEFIDNQCG
jgi:hypothetical protein